jgi:hypothetical protein
MSTGPLKSLNGFVPFPSNNFWNTDISNAPVDPKSANYINYIGSATPLHPDFGAGLYGGQSIGIPYQIEAAAQPGVRVKLGAYASESGPGPAPIPANALIEGYPKPGSADSVAIWDLLENEQRPYTWTSADAAGLPVFVGLTDPAAPPMGMRMRLNATFDISGYSASNQVILTALQKYGMIVADNGSAMYVTGMPDQS